MKKNILTILFMLALFLTVSAQKKMSDREFESFKGQVKTVSIESMALTNFDGVPTKSKRNVWGVKSFDKDGRLLEKIYQSINYKVVFSIVDGFKTFKSMEIEKKKTDRGNGGFGSVSIREFPIEGTDKIVPPDPRFDERYTYEYDSKGRVTAERQYLNNGKLNQLKTFKYDENDRLIEEIRNDTVAITKNTYNYDDKGNEVENLEDRDIKGAGVDSISKTVYSEYVVDSKGNWTQRKSKRSFEVNGKPQELVKMDYQIFTYH